MTRIPKPRADEFQNAHLAEVFDHPVVGGKCVTGALVSNAKKIDAIVGTGPVSPSGRLRVMKGVGETLAKTRGLVGDARDALLAACGKALDVRVAQHAAEKAKAAELDAARSQVLGAIVADAHAKSVNVKAAAKDKESALFEEFARYEVGAVGDSKILAQQFADLRDRSRPGRFREFCETVLEVAVPPGVRAETLSQAYVEIERRFQSWADASAASAARIEASSRAVEDERAGAALFDEVDRLAKEKVGFYALVRELRGAAAEEFEKRLASAAARLKEAVHPKNVSSTMDPWNGTASGSYAHPINTVVNSLSKAAPTSAGFWETLHADFPKRLADTASYSNEGHRLFSAAPRVAPAAALSPADFGDYLFRLVMAATSDDPQVKGPLELSASIGRFRDEHAGLLRDLRLAVARASVALKSAKTA